MQVTVCVAHIDAETSRAAITSPVVLATEGATRAGALGQLQTLVQPRLAGGDVLHLELSTGAAAPPWLPLAGIWKAHPDFEAVLETMAAQRRQQDAEAVEACACGGSIPLP